MLLFTVSETKCKPHWHWTADGWIRYLQMGDCVCVFWHLALSGSTLHHLFNSRSSCVSFLPGNTRNTPDLSLRYTSWRKQHKLRGFMGNLSSGTSWENKSEISIWTKTFLVKFFQKIKHYMIWAAVILFLCTLNGCKLLTRLFLFFLRNFKKCKWNIMRNI